MLNRPRFNGKPKIFQFGRKAAQTHPTGSEWHGLPMETHGHFTNEGVVLFSVIKMH